MSFAGPRKMLLERCLYYKMDEAMEREVTQPNPVRGFRTEYGDAVGVPNFIPSMDNIHEDSEVMFSGSSYYLCLV
jgi:hypothetical protein